MGNRVFKGSSVNGNRKYVVDISGQLPTILLELDPSDGMKVKKTYMYANGEILMQHNGNHTAGKYFYLHDRLGSVREVIDANNVVVNNYTYSPFGQTIEEGGTLTNPFMFTGQFYDSETGQYYLRARQYDPQLMRFTAYDPVRGQFEEPMTLHKYLYCENEPINKVDLTGLWEKGLNAGGDWLGHSDMGYGRDNFLYEEFDNAFPAWNPLFTEFHFLDLDQAEGFVYMALLGQNQTSFGYAGHMGQDYFSHYGKGYRAFGGPDDWGHCFHIKHDADNPDNPYVYDKKGNIIDASSEYKEADKWTKQMEDLWYLFEDPYKWIGASD